MLQMYRAQFALIDIQCYLFYSEHRTLKKTYCVWACTTNKITKDFIYQTEGASLALNIKYALKHASNVQNIKYKTTVYQWIEARFAQCDGGEMNWMDCEFLFSDSVLSKCSGKRALPQRQFQEPYRAQGRVFA